MSLSAKLKRYVSVLHEIDAFHFSQYVFWIFFSSSIHRCRWIWIHIYSVPLHDNRLLYRWYFQSTIRIFSPCFNLKNIRFYFGAPLISTRHAVIFFYFLSHSTMFFVFCFLFFDETFHHHCLQTFKLLSSSQSKLAHYTNLLSSHSVCDSWAIIIVLIC